MHHHQNSFILVHFHHCLKKSCTHSLSGQLFSKVAAPGYNPTRSVGGSNFSTSSPTLAISLFNYSRLTGYEVLSCSLITDDVECFVTSLLAIYVSSLEKCLFRSPPPLFFFWLHHVLGAASRIFSLGCGTQDLQLQHVGSSSLTRDLTQALCIGNTKSQPLDH